MDVAKDALLTGGNDGGGTVQSASGATTISSTGITVGVGASLLVMTLVSASNGFTAPSSISATWNGVAMSKHSEITSGGAGSNGAYSVIFTLVNPASGAHTLAASWTNAVDAYMSAVSFTGTDTTTGVNGADDTTATQTTSIAVPSSTDGATVACFGVNGATPTMNFNAIFAVSDLNPGGGANYQLGGTSNTHTFTGAGGTNQALSGVHVIAAAAGGSVGTASGSATVAGHGASLAQSHGSAAGVGSATGHGAALAKSAGTSAGVASAAGVGKSLALSHGTAAGAAAASGVGKSLAASHGNAAGVATVSGVGASTGGGSTGVAAGVATVSGHGASLFKAHGSASGVAAALGRSASIFAARGTSAGLATVRGVSPSAVVAGIQSISRRGRKPNLPMGFE